METGSEGESNRNVNDHNNGQSDGSKKPKRQMKTPFQLNMLEKTYASDMYPSEAVRAQLSESLGLTDRQLQMWFCHRRLKDKKEGTLKTPGGDRKELIKPAKQEFFMVDRGGVGGGSDHGSRSRSHHESWARSRSRSGSGSGSDSDSSEFNEPLVHSRAYELTQERMMLRRIIECVEAQLGEPLRDDGPALGTEFDELPPGAFGTPIAVKKSHGQTSRRSYEGNLFEQPPMKDGMANLQEGGVPSIKHEPYGAISRLYDSPVSYPSDQRLVLHNGLQPPPYGASGHSKGVSLSTHKRETGHFSSPIHDNDFIQPNEEVMQMWRKRKSEDGGRDGPSEKRMMMKELEKKDMLRKKKEEQMKKEMERQDRERRKEEERMMRERQRLEEKFQREERREIERREKFLQRESLKAERLRQKEEIRREKEAIKMKAAIEKAAARKIAKESMELIEDERLELLELAASDKGLTSIVSLDYETLQNLDSFRDRLCVFPPKSVQVRFKSPFSVHPWIDSEENVGNLFMVWRFCMTFADILGIWPFTLDEFIQALHDYDSRLLGEVHIALLKLIIKDIEDVARTPSGGPGTNQYTVGNPEGGHPQIVEGAYMWGFDIRSWLKHLNPLTWPEILRQFALSAGFGPLLKKDKVKHSGLLPENDEGKGCEDVITMLRNGSAAENAATLMQEKGTHLQKKSRHRMTPGTLKFAAYHVLCLEGSKGLNVLELAEKIQKTGLRDLTTSKTPDASISVALSRDQMLFERIAPSTYCVRPPYRKDPATADEVISSAKEKIRTYASGILSGVNVEDVEKDDDYESEVVEGQEIDGFGTSTIKDANFYNEGVKTSICEDVDVGMKTEFENTGVGLSNINQQSTEIDERKLGDPWVQGLTEGEYSDLCVEDRLNALVALIGIANEGNTIRLVLEDRLDAATSARKQIWNESQLDKKRLKEEFTTKFQDYSFIATTEGSQSPLIPSTDNKIDRNLQLSQNGSVGLTNGQIHNNGNNTTERSRLQLKAYIGHKAEEMYVYRSLPLGQDRRRNRYWQFVASNSRLDPGSGRIFVELQNGCWRLIDSEEAFDALLSSLDTRGARESHLHIMLQKIESSFKENIRRNSNVKRVSISDSTDSTFKIEFTRNELEKENAMKRYQDLEKWMWKECLYSSSLSAKAHGKQSCAPLQGICDSCHGCYCYEKAVCPRCYRLFSTFGGKLCYPELDVQDNIREANNPNDWDITHPIRTRLIKSLLTILEACIPCEALQSSWTENSRNTWGSKLHDSSSPADLLQVLTQFESVIKRDYLSLEFETTEELLGTTGLSGRVGSGSGSIPVLPWIPQTTAAVSLRLLELDGLISYTPEQKAKLKMVNESSDLVVEKAPLKFTFLKNIGKTVNTDHSKPIKPPRGGGGRSRGGGKLQRQVAGLSLPGGRQNIRVNVATSQVTKHQTYETGPLTIGKRTIEKAQEDEPVRNFNDGEWIHVPVDKMETDNPNFHVSEEETSESDDDGEEDQVGFEMENGESSGYGLANYESRWGEMEVSNEEGFENVGEDDEIMNDDCVDGNDGRNFKVEDSDSDSDSDSFGSGEYSD